MVYVINAAAKAYDGVIPEDCYRVPYMPMEDLRREMAAMTFYGYEGAGQLIGVMGIQPVGEVTLIRHSYVHPDHQRKGVGSTLLTHLLSMAPTKGLLVGTWRAAHWAIKFYKKHGFTLLLNKDDLLRTYWDIPERQIETSVVLGMINEAAFIRHRGYRRQIVSQRSPISRRKPKANKARREKPGAGTSSTP